MKKKLVVANWKAYIVSKTRAEKLFISVCRAYAKIQPKTRPDVVACVPFLYLSPLRAVRYTPKAFLGVQNVFWQPEGPYTGEITGHMLRDAGATHVIVGHSERRKYIGETDEMVNKKVLCALQARLKVVLCVGEWMRPRTDAEQKKVYAFVESQLVKAMAGGPNSFVRSVIITYEPVWAISANKKQPDTPEDAARMVAYIRVVLGRLYDAGIASHARIIYGGSVSQKNAALFMRRDGIDGVLVGAASTRPKEFAQIIRLAAGSL